MRNGALVLASGAAPTLGACGSETTGEITTADGEKAEYTLDTDGGETAMTIRSEDGTATMRSGDKVAVELRECFTSFTGAKVITNAVVNQADEKGTMVMFETSDPTERVIAHFRKQAKDAGFEIGLEVNSGGTRMIGGERKRDGSSLSVTATANEGDATTGQLMIGSRKGG
jgi:hypothetical protein